MSTLKTITIPEIGGPADVIEILVKPGDEVDHETTIITLESDKATMEVPASTQGIVKAINVKLGDKVNTGATILTVEVTEKEKAKKESLSDSPKKDTMQHIVSITDMPITHMPSADTSTITPSTNDDMPSLLDDDSNIHAGPVVRRIARQFGINLALVQGKGPKQRILKEDVQAFVRKQLAQSTTPDAINTATTSTEKLVLPDFSPFGQTSLRPLSRIKKISGQYLQRNWASIPHVTQFGTADITELEAFRQTHKTAITPQKLTLLVFVIQAVVATLKVFPHFNASLDSASQTLVLKHYFHIGVAVDTPNGLVVPVIRDADKKNAFILAAELDVLSKKARQQQLTLMEMQGGCFSISSLGGIGGTAFTPIINFPEVAILGLSKATYTPIYQNGSFVPRLTLPLSLSYDHRVIDGAEGARFMVHLEKLLADIRCLLL